MGWFTSNKAVVTATVIDHNAHFVIEILALGASGFENRMALINIGDAYEQFMSDVRLNNNGQDVRPQARRAYEQACRQHGISATV